jgi:hypothetical protein
MWGSGLYESELVNERGTWKFRRLHIYWMYRVFYKGGWAKPADGDGQQLPSRFTPPFHY